MKEGVSRAGTPLVYILRLKRYQAVAIRLSYTPIYTTFIYYSLPTLYYLMHPYTST
jgi:hypothetical protein